MAALSKTPDLSVGGRKTYETREWSWLTIPGEVGARDRAVLERLARRRSSSAVEHYSVEGAVRLKVTGAVGVLDLDIGRIVIRPKFMDEVQLLRLVQVVSGLRHIELFAGAPTLAEGTSLPDLLAELLVREVRRLLQGGLKAGYVTREAPLPALRGRLLADRQQIERFGLVDRVVCRFEELNYNVFDNQLLIDGLAAARPAVQNAPLRMRVSELHADLLELARPANALERLGSLKRIRQELDYDRLNNHYRLAHELCLRLIDGRALDDDVRPGETPTRAFLIETAPLFESFVEAITRQVLPDWEIASQAPAVLYRRADSGSTYTAQRPDLIATQGEVRLPIDAKYKQYSLIDSSRKVSAGDLNQIYAYSQALAPASSDQARVAALVFPTVEPGPTTGTGLMANSEVNVDQSTTRLLLIAVHVPTALDALETPGDSIPDLRALLLAPFK